MEQNKKKIAAVLIALVLLAVLLVFGRGTANNAGPQGTTSGETIAADPVADRNNGQEQGKENTSPDGKEQTGESAQNTAEKQTAKPATSTNKTASSENTNSRNESDEQASSSVGNPVSKSGKSGSNSSGKSSGKSGSSSTSKNNDSKEQGWQGFGSGESSEILLPPEPITPTQVETAEARPESESGESKMDTPGDDSNGPEVNNQAGSSENNVKETGHSDQPSQNEEGDSGEEGSENTPSNNDKGVIELPIILFD